MKYKIGSRVRVTNPYSGGNFDDGDIVTIEQIGCEDEPDCYGAISPYDNMMWFLNENEVQPATRADYIRSMSDEQLGEFLGEWANDPPAWRRDGAGEVLSWLKDSFLPLPWEIAHAISKKYHL